jgi:hypothetical protein
MRYYEVRLPGDSPDEPCIVTKVKSLRNLPDGTTVRAIVTERDGTLADSWDIPVAGGRAQVKKRGVQAPQYYGL